MKISHAINTTEWLRKKSNSCDFKRLGGKEQTSADELARCRSAIVVMASLEA